MRLRRVQVVAGLTKVAYTLLDGRLTIWLGEWVKQAPAGAMHTEITDGHRAFVMVDYTPVIEEPTHFIV